MTSGWQGAPCLRRYGRELVSKPAISLKKNWGGYLRTTLHSVLFKTLTSSCLRGNDEVVVAFTIREAEKHHSFTRQG